ncbi:HEPN domain-containing protein [Flagellimonas lutaonensis]|uniref:RiboL-PSP-HEPN domain-containing protein n=1 Tax=Flagellimonas lutaonensis TaxID=516051 RepID=A0A0D5YQG6_9FLAO|nr:HEPN domain-containing protein [Allomuricauda lutaonensis]AKA34525.1 hypothetical protein VC82_871 [Allomuricauda lutaonensis]
MQDDIFTNYDRNIKRVKNLVKVYDVISSSKSGRKKVVESDILRSAAVLLHSSFEDFLRSILIWKAGSIKKEELDKIPLKGISNSGRPSKFLLGALKDHEEITVKELIIASVIDYSKFKSFSNIGEVKQAINLCGFEITEGIEKYSSTIQKLIQRRHKIVHEADRYDKPGSGNHRIRSISKKNINNWMTAIDMILRELLKQMRSS